MVQWKVVCPDKPCSGCSCCSSWSLHGAAGEFMACPVPAVSLNCSCILWPIKINLSSSASLEGCSSSCSSGCLPAGLKWFWQLSPFSGQCHWSCKSWVWVSRLIHCAKLQQTLWFKPSRDSSELSGMSVGIPRKYKELVVPSLSQKLVSKAHFLGTG